MSQWLIGPLCLAAAAGIAVAYCAWEWLAGQHRAAREERERWWRQQMETWTAPPPAQDTQPAGRHRGEP